MNRLPLRSLKLTLLFAFSFTATNAFAQLAPEETCRKAGEALIGQKVEGAYLDSFTLNDTDAGAILQLSELFRGPGAQRDALGSLGGALQLNPNNPRFALALTQIERAVPIQRIGLQTTCRIAGLAAGQIQFKPDRSSKESREVKDVPVVMTITAAGSSSGVEVLQGDHAVAFQEAASEFEKSLRLRSAQAHPPTQAEAPARTEIPRLGQVEPPVPKLPPPSISPPPPPRISSQQGAAATAQTPSDFPLKDGRYLPASSRCMASEEEFEGFLVSEGGQELLVQHDTPCKRISYGPNSEGVGIVWKCADEKTVMIYQTVRPDGRHVRVSQWNNEFRGQPRSTETFEHCPNPTFRERSSPRVSTVAPRAPQATATPPDAGRRDVSQPSLSGEKNTIAYGSRTGMEADIIERRGVDTANARIAIRHSRRNAASYCAEYLSDTSVACIDQTMRTVKLQTAVRGNCVNGEFVTATGARFRFLGPDTATPRHFRISDSTGQVLDGGAASGYDMALSTFRALCPTRFSGGSATQAQPFRAATTEPQRAGSAAPKFEDHPSTRYLGPLAKPDFASDGSKFLTYRTRIADAMQQGANFAGNMTLLEVGCGTGCRFVIVGNIQTGKLASFPLGGEDNLYLNLRYRSDSRLIVAHWQSATRCIRQSFVWTGRGFDQVDNSDVGSAEECDQVRERQAAQLTVPTAPTPSPVAKASAAHSVSCTFDGRWRVQVEASCARFRSTAIVENCKIVRGGHLRNASGSIDPSTGAVTYRVAASADEGTPGGNGIGTLRRDQNGNGRITFGPGCEGSMRWWRE